MNCKPDFQTYSIVYLYHREVRLYAEVIQVAEVRQIGWLRPLVMVIASPQPETTPEQGPCDNPIVYNLRQAADLLLPIALFQPALDTDVVPWLAQLPGSDMQVDQVRLAQQQLNQFIWQIWEAHPDVFQA